MATAVRAASVSSGALVGLVAAAIFLNYVDRGLIGIAAPLMKSELALSATGFGLAVSAFFWIYAPAQLLVGWLCDRFCVYRLFAASLALWALATALTGFVGGLAALIMLRVGLGLGESIAFPGSSKIIARHVPESRRGIANAWIAAAISLGPAFGTFAGGMVMAGYGWRAMFVGFGVATLAWLLPWLVLVRPLTGAMRPPAPPPYPMSRLLGHRALWATSLCHFTSNYGFYFLLAWLPLYLVQARGFSLAGTSTVAATIFLVQGVTAPVWGWLSDHWVAQGRSEGEVRKALLVAGQGGLALSIVMMGVTANIAVMIGWLMLAGIFAAAIAANVFAVGQIFAGPRAAGSWIGIQNALGNISGIIGPVLAGLLIDWTGNYMGAILLAAAVTAAGALGWWRLVPRIAPIALD
jgi:MFS family permease